jgi:hypothetical protein
MHRCSFQDSTRNGDFESCGALLDIETGPLECTSTHRRVYVCADETHTQTRSPARDNRNAASALRIRLEELALVER